MLARVAHEGFLLAADTVPYGPSLGAVHDLGHTLEWPDLDPGLNALSDRDDAVHGWLVADRLPKRLLKIVLEQACHFGVDRLDLMFIDTHHKGQQAVAQAAFGPLHVDQPAPAHRFQLLAHGLPVSAGARCDLGRCLWREPQLCCQRGLIWRKELGQEAQFHATVGGWVPIGQRVQLLCQALIGIVCHLVSWVVRGLARSWRPRCPTGYHTRHEVSILGSDSGAPASAAA